MSKIYILVDIHPDEIWDDKVAEMDYINKGIPAISSAQHKHKELIKERIDKGLIKAYIHEKNKERGDRVLAQYDESELKPSDLKKIKEHHLNKARVVGTDKPIQYYSFTNCNYLEVLRHKKLRLLERKDMLDQDDGTIFGEVKKTIKIPEQIIPEHEKEISVYWNCWDDIYETDDERRR